MNGQAYEYTLLREPEHEVLLEHASGKKCADWMQRHEGMLGYCGWKYLRRKLLAGLEEGYRLIMYEVCPPDARDGFKSRAARGADSEVNKVPAMCGYCDKWARGAGERVDGLRMGVCGATGLETERCHWCDAKR